MTQPRTPAFSNLAVHRDKECGIHIVQEHKLLPSAGWDAACQQCLPGVKMVRRCCHSPVVVNQHWAGHAVGLLNAKGVPARATYTKSQQQQRQQHTVNSCL